MLLTGQTADVLVGPRGELVRNPQWLSGWAAQRGRDMLVLDARGIEGRPGAQVLAPPGHAPRQRVRLDPAPLTDLLAAAHRAVLAAGTPTVVFVDFSCLALDHDDSGDLLRMLAELPVDPAFTRSGHLLVLAFPTRSPRELSALPGWAVVDAGLPDGAERRQILLGCDAVDAVPRRPGLTLERVATNLGGLTGDALLRLVAEARTGRPLSDSRVAEIKSAEIRRMAGDTLSVSAERRSMAELAGLANLRLYLAECDAAGTPPGVVLLAGPPGTGKTRSWLAVADHLGVPAVRLGQIRSRYVGDSENNWAIARRVLVATAPSCVLLDEADQAGLGRRGPDLDSGVSARLRAELWDFLNECSDLGITVIATTNNPAGLDPAALDRVTVLPVLHPTPAEAAQIMAIEAGRAGWVLDGGERAVLDAYSGLLTGRQVVRLLGRAARAAAMAGRPGRVSGTDVAAAADDALDVGQDVMHELMALSALVLADSRSAWPWVAATRLGEHAEIPRYLTGMLDHRGEVDLARLRDRLTALQRMTP